MEQKIPLAERMRPKRIEDIAGQEHLTGTTGALRLMMKNKQIPSLLLWGPPGVGKTTIAEVLASELKMPFHTLSAISSGVKDVREVIKKAKDAGLFGKGSPLLFIDEIHRFSKSQQDSLLGAVERGIITLIGATTENPSFEVIPALLSRCQVYVLEPLTKDDLIRLVDRALTEDSVLTKKNITVKEYDALLKISGGDARKLLNTLELIVYSFPSEPDITITNEAVENTVKNNLPKYDKTGEMHYDIVSAFIKSIRGSDPNAAVYYLARMIAGGEDPKFIARRLIIAASEDIGLANPTALIMANTTFEAVKNIGYPECEIILSQCAVYLATSPKSNASYTAIKDARKFVAETGDLPVPLHLRNAPTRLMKELNYGKSYKYAHDFENNFVHQEFLPEEIAESKFYEPGKNAREHKIREHLQRLWRKKYKY